MAFLWLGFFILLFRSFTWFLKYILIFIFFATGMSFSSLLFFVLFLHFVSFALFSALFGVFLTKHRQILTGQITGRTQLFNHLWPWSNISAFYCTSHVETTCTATKITLNTCTLLVVTDTTLQVKVLLRN